MNQENIFRGQEKIQGKANEINESVDAHYERPRVNKDRPQDDVAHEIIKDDVDKLVPLREIPDEIQDWYDNMRNAGVRFMKDGFLEISRWDNTGKNFGKPKLLKQKIDGVNSAIRMQDHILELYLSQKKEEGSEYSKIESIQEVIEYANELLINWIAANQDTKKNIQMQLADVVLQLEKCRNEFKLEVKDQAEQVMKLKDSTGRENPGALAARTVAALNNLTKRINEMQLIAPLIALRKEVLMFEKRRSVGAIRKAEGLLSGISHHAVFIDNSKIQPESRINDYEVTILDRKIGQVLYLLDTVYVAPYFQQAQQAKFVIVNNIKNHFNSKREVIENVERIQEMITDVQNILKSDVENMG